MTGESEPDRGPESEAEAVVEALMRDRGSRVLADRVHALENALAEAVGDLRTARDTITTMRSRQGQSEQALGNLAREVKKSAEQQGGDDEPAPAGIRWHVLIHDDPELHDELWERLEQWIDTDFSRTYAYVELRQCWRDHPDVVDAMTAFWQADVELRQVSPDQVAPARCRRDLLSACWSQIRFVLESCRGDACTLRRSLARSRPTAV